MMNTTENEMIEDLKKAADLMKMALILMGPVAVILGGCLVLAAVAAISCLVGVL
jgi:hypothetical protein